MELSIPIYVEARRQAHDKHLLYDCRPLFFSQIAASDAQLGRAMTALAKRLKLHLDTLGALPRHEALAEWSYAPELRTHQHKLTLDLRSHIAHCRLLFVEFMALSRRIVFSPQLPELWFELKPNEDLETRATAIYTRHFRRLAGKQEVPPVDPRSPETHSLSSQAWVTNITLNVSTRLPKADELKRKFALLFDESHMDGGVELQRVGRCLNWQYPDDLARAVRREHEVHELSRLLRAKDRRPIALVGPRLSGKTAVLHEYVYRDAERRKNPYSAKQNVWLLSPQRLISGMSFVGQWENRLLAILREAKRRKHVLYFDDFLGLYHAGISRDANLCAADVLKPALHRRDVRIVAEMTTEAWHAFEERDRGLADQFHVLPIAATNDDETLQIMLAVQQLHEAEQRTQFALEALPTILELQQRYVRDAAFPGKAAVFARHLARKFAGKHVRREEVLDEFHDRTGVALALLDRRRKLERKEVLQKLRALIVGQHEAVEACADVVSIAKAGLNTPGKPLGTLLFLGPTGVGKTQCAKALAEVLFSSAARLLRFDMNEYVTPWSITQLIGTLAEPDGLLSGAVRRQPFAVLLLDEVEKAHPDLFDLLLQVTGEGRLTDALGRTADFSNCVIVMTSNLGVATAGRKIGLVEDPQTRRQAFVKAAEDFFRPEFFNRIDRVVPFSSLERGEMKRIAHQVLARVFQRDGLVRRRCALEVTDAALERIVDAGYHPQYGGRALKRAIEQQLLQPVAAGLSGVAPELPAVIGIYPRGQQITAQVFPLASVAPAPARPTPVSPEQTLSQAQGFLARVQNELESLRPDSSSGLSREQVRYYAFKEHVHRLREAITRLQDHVRSQQRSGSRVETTPNAKTYTQAALQISQREAGRHRILLDMHSASDIHAYLQDLASDTTTGEQLQADQQLVLDEATLLEAMLRSEGAEEVVLVFRAIVPEAMSHLHHLAFQMQQFYGEQLGFEVEQLSTVMPRFLRMFSVMAVSGPGLWNLVEPQQGVHLACRKHENLLPVQATVLPCIGQTPVQVMLEHADRLDQWLQDVASGKQDPAAHPDPPGQVVRLYDGATTVDLRTGLSAPRPANRLDLRTWLCAGLPLPPEFKVL